MKTANRTRLIALAMAVAYGLAIAATSKPSNAAATPTTPSKGELFIQITAQTQPAAGLKEAIILVSNTQGVAGNFQRHNARIDLDPGIWTVTFGWCTHAGQCEGLHQREVLVRPRTHNRLIIEVEAYHD